MTKDENLEFAVTKCSAAAAEFSVAAAKCGTAADEVTEALAKLAAVLYECDPQKNTSCDKTHCGDFCTLTTHCEFARDPSVGRQTSIVGPACRHPIELDEEVRS